MGTFSDDHRHTERAVLMRLGKYHGLGNDFLIALECENPGLAPDSPSAQALCDRRLGVGADGIIYGLAPTDPANDLKMVLLNADGSRAELSGNGIRCLAQAWLRTGDRGLQQGPGEPQGPGHRDDASPLRDDEPHSLLRIETDTGVREVRTVGGDPRDRIELSAEMGQPSVGPSPTRESMRWGARNVCTVDVGNPHLVLEVDDASAVEPAIEGPRLEAGYRGGINVHFVSVTDGAHILMRVWERGAGVTEACGSGAVAAVFAAARWGSVDPGTGPVEVTMPGGSVKVAIVDSTAWLTGPSVHVAEVFVDRIAPDRMPGDGAPGDGSAGGGSRRAGMVAP